MSGIVGILNLDGSPVDGSLLSRLTDYLTFRGPDAQETWSQGPVGLGHALFQTADDTRPDCQPLSLDGQVWITADARIDGRAELRQKLSSHGCHDLEDVPDVELILHAYLAWGEECVKHLLGDFAFAIWDGRRRRLFCARDHFGIKPFFYAHVGKSLIFSNTLNCLRLHPQVSDRLNELAVADFLLFNCNQDQATTTFEDIRRLPPAHFLTLQGSRLRAKRYWSLPVFDQPLSYPRQQEYVDHFRFLLDEAVADRLRTRRIAVIMSGGLDSTTVAASAKQILSQTSAPYDLRAYTMVYNRLIPDNERHYAGLTASSLNIPIVFQHGDDYHLYEGYDSNGCTPEPSHWPTSALFYETMRQAGTHTRVILAGDGGDAILANPRSYLWKMFKGFHWGHLALEFGRCIGKYHCLPPVGLRTTMKAWLGIAPAWTFPAWLNPYFSDRLALQERWDQFHQEAAPTASLRDEAYENLSSAFWANSFESQFDPGTTGFQIEFRHPFFDVRLVTYALSLPPLPWCLNKILLREAGRGLLPEEIRRRPKTPLSTDPAGVLFQRIGDRFTEFLPLTFKVGPYINIDAFTKIITCMDNHFLIGNNLRPISLNLWLNCWWAKNSAKSVLSTT